MWHSTAFMMKYVTNKKWLFFGYIALLLESFTPIVAVMYQRDLIDLVLINKEYELFPLLLVLYMIFFFSPKLWFTVRRVLFNSVSFDLRMNLTDVFIRKIYSLSAKEYHKKHSGKLLNHISNDITTASDVAVNQIISEGMKSFISIIFLTLSLAYLNVTLLFVVLVLAVIYFVLVRRLGKKTKAYSKNVKTEKGEISVNIEEGISGMKDVVAFNRQKWQIENFGKKFDHYLQAVMAEGFYKAKTIIVSEPFLYGTKLMVVLFGAVNAIENDKSLGAFVVSFTLVDQLVTELGVIFDQALSGKRLAASVECIKSVLNLPSEIAGTKELDEKVSSIKFENVTFSYSEDTEPVLKDLSINFPVGKKIAIVGESGSGKSTITQLLLKAYTPNNGKITMNDLHIKEIGEQFTDKVSVVFQQPHFIPTSIRKNITFDKDYQPHEIERACKEMLCHDFIKDFPENYGTEVGERGTRLSGGQKQRIALARAILRDSDVLILDEATSALDTDTEYHVQKNIDKIRQGKTTIVIAHRISTVQNADVIYVLDKGRVVAEGSHDTLLKESDVYKKLYAFQ